MPTPRLLLLALLCACLPGLARAQAENSGVYLTWRDDPATTITVNWLNLYADAPATAWYRRPGGEWRRVDGTAEAPGAGKLPIDNPRSIAIRQHWLPHLERYGATAIFENDHHNYKRSHRLRGHRRDDDNGLLFLGDGAWGVRTRTVPSPSEGWWLAKAEPTRHLFHVTLQPSGQARIVAVNDQGGIFDEVNLATPRTRPVNP